MSNSRWGSRMRIGSAMLAILAVAGVACSKSEPDPGTVLDGPVFADGSSTVFPITQAVAEEFSKEANAKDVKVTVGTSGTGGGFKKFCKGETDISDASRPIKDSEKADCVKNGITDPVELTIAIDGLSVVTNPSNTFVDCLTTAELKKIWEPGSKVNNWSQVRAGFPSKALKLYGPGTDSGTFDYWTAEINGKEKASRTGYVASENDNELVSGVSGDTGGLGYFGFAYYEENAQKLRLLGVDDGQGCVKPSKETINGGTYKPLSRPLFIYVSKKSLTKPQVVGFIDYYLENVNELVDSVGYIPLPAAQLDAEVAEWKAAKGA